MGPPSGGPLFGSVVSTLLVCHQMEIETSVVVKHTQRGNHHAQYPPAH